LLQLLDWYRAVGCLAKIRKIFPLLWRKTYFHVKLFKTCRVRVTFGEIDRKSAHRCVARSTCPSQSEEKRGQPTTVKRAQKLDGKIDGKKDK